MQKAGFGRNLIASSRIAFALLAPAVAGCATPSQTPAPGCISPHASAREAQAVTESALRRISHIYGLMLGRLRKVEAEIEALPPEARGRRTIHFIMDVHMAFAENALIGIKERMYNLEAGILEAHGDEDMRMMAQRACAARDFAEITFLSVIRILEDASAEIRAAGKE